ncbi:hypothetical protein [Kitasatospora griseola]
MTTEATFIVSRDDESEAWALGFRLGRQLAAWQIAGRYGIAVRRISGRRDDPGWAVSLVDRTPGEPAPRLLIGSVPRTMRALAVELLALAA